MCKGYKAFDLIILEAHDQATNRVNLFLNQISIVLSLSNLFLKQIFMVLSYSNLIFKQNQKIILHNVQAHVLT